MMSLISSQSPLTPQQISALLLLYALSLCLSSSYRSLIMCRDIGANSIAVSAAGANSVSIFVDVLSYPDTF